MLPSLLFSVASATKINLVGHNIFTSFVDRHKKRNLLKDKSECNPAIAGTMLDIIGRYFTQLIFARYQYRTYQLQLGEACRSATTATIDDDIYPDIFFVAPKQFSGTRTSERSIKNISRQRNVNFAILPGVRNQDTEKKSKINEIVGCGLWHYPIVYTYT